MKCFENIIGIKRLCDSEPSVSDLYINDLSGFSLKDADSAINSEYASGVRLIKDKIAFATNLIISQLKAGTTKLLVRSVIDSGQVGIFKEVEIIPSIPNKLKGIQYRVQDYAYLAFRLNSISFFSHETKEIELYVYDLTTGELLDTFPLSAEEGKIITIQTDKKYLSRSRSLNLFICTDSDILFNQASLYKGHCGGCTNNFNTAYSYLGYGEIEGGIDVNSLNIKGGSSTGGISISYSLECDIEPYLCSIKGSLGMPILYKTGSLLMDEMIYSKRLNSTISVYRENHAELKDQFETEYMASMAGVFSSLSSPNDICFSCNSSIKFRSIAP